MTDGRKLRGEERRRRLVQATLAVVERDGLAGLTHRAVAEQAGVSLASASYHFAGIDELVATALTHATEEAAEALRSDSDRSLPRLARLLCEDVDHNRGRWIACYELYLLALRRPDLRESALAWLDLMADTFAPELTGTRRRAFQAMVEGISLHLLLRGQDYDAAQIEAMLALAATGA